MKIGSLTPLWNQEPFVTSHFEMLSKLDKNVVLMANAPLPDYNSDHGYSEQADRTLDLIRKFPKVEIYESTYHGPFCCDLYNEGLQYLQDCDIVFRLDPDMFMFDKDWEMWISFIRSNPEIDCYRVNFSKCTINYYKDFDHGLQDAQEFDVLAFNPHKQLIQVLDYPARNPYIINWNNWMIHHFRGWNKPKSVTKDWENSDYAKEVFPLYNNNGDWFHCPQEIKDKFDKKSAITWLSKIGIDTF
jgi:hypothetical protein